MWKLFDTVPDQSCTSNIVTSSRRMCHVPPNLTSANFTSCPHSCMYVFCMDPGTNSDYNINWSVFITETESVYCAVRAGSLNAIQVIGRAMFQAVWRRPLTAEARVWSEIRPWEIYAWQSGTKVGLPVLRLARSTSVGYSSSPTRCSYVPEGQTVQAWEPSKISVLVRELGSLDRKVLSLSVFK